MNSLYVPLTFPIHREIGKKMLGMLIIPITNVIKAPHKVIVLEDGDDINAWLRWVEKSIDCVLYNWNGFEMGRMFVASRVFVHSKEWLEFTGNQGCIQIKVAEFVSRVSGSSEADHEAAFSENILYRLSRVSYQVLE
jgi:hypothetical protein